jgi:hypothetical protein
MDKNETFITRLKKIFSSNSALVNIGGNKIKVIDFNQRQLNNVPNNFQFYDYERYGRLYSTLPYSLMNSTQAFNYQLAKIELYKAYEDMDRDSILSSVIDIYADEASQTNEYGNVLKISSTNGNIHDVLQNLFYDIMNIEFNIWTWIRNLVKYGDFFLKLNLTEQHGIINIQPMSPYSIVRIENIYDANSEIKFMYDPLFGIDNSMYGAKVQSFDEYEVAHFRLITDSNFLPYGRSILEPARKSWEQLIMMEDSMMINRIMRAPAKRVFKIDIGNIPPHEIDNFMEKTIARLKKVPYMDESTGNYNLKFNMQNMLEDFYLPVRGGNSGTQIDTLEGLEFNGTDDIEYLRNRMMAALKVPKAFLGYEEGVEGKCLSLDTLIPLINGKTKTLQQLIDDYNNNIKNYTYSIDINTKEIKIGEIEWAGITRKNTQVIKVILDNDKYIICTPDHKFMLRDGTYIEAQYLNINDSLMPLYLDKTTQKNKKGYITVYNPSTEKYKEVHRIVGEQYHNIYTGSGKIVHHKDFDKLNNYTENLDCTMNYIEHRNYHVDNIMKTMNSKENLLKRSNSLYWRECVKRSGKNGGLKSGKRLGQWVKDNGPVNKKPDLFTNCVICGKQFKIHHYRKNTVRHCGNTICRTQYHSITKIADTYNTKYSHISIEILTEIAKNAKSFKHLGELLNIYDNNTINKLFNYLGINKIEFVINNMPIAMKNKHFVNNIKRFIPEYKNHKVKAIEWLNDKIDTGDITIKDYHNFGTDAGVIIHNSTLAAEDLRFARTIERLQRIIESELYKIALVHLYLQGFRNEDLVDFKLKLTPASTIYEREKIDIWKEKMELITTMKETKMLPKSWIYENLLEIDTDEWEALQDDIVNDAKFDYRLAQISEAGADPKDVAEKSKEDSLSGEGDNNWGMDDTAENTDEPKEESKEPKEDTKEPKEDTKEPIFKDAFTNAFADESDDKYGMSTKIHHDFHGGSPLSMEQQIEKTQLLIESVDKLYDKKIEQDLLKFSDKINKKLSNKNKLTELIGKRQ